MGVVNVTPDSFSDGGQWFGADAAVTHGLELAAQGADIVDVGGESTRPGAQRITAEEELRRVRPVIDGLVAAGLPVSVDTMRAEVAEQAVQAGARLVNDVSGGLADPEMPRLVGAAGVPYVVMHWRGHSHSMDSRAVYQDVVREVSEELCRRVDVVTAQGVDPAMIVLDPGLGFAKRPDHNWALLTHLDQVSTLGGRAPGFPVLIGASRKRFLGRLLAAPDGTPRPFAGSDDATVSVTALAAVAGAWCARVHRVPANADAVRVAEAWRHATHSDTARPDTARPGTAPRHAPPSAARSWAGHAAGRAGQPEPAGERGRARLSRGAGRDPCERDRASRETPPRTRRRTGSRSAGCASTAITACWRSSAGMVRSSSWTRCSGWTRPPPRTPTTYR